VGIAECKEELYLASITITTHRTARATELDLLAPYIGGHINPAVSIIVASVIVAVPIA
jgi:hypothetical protein